MPLDFLKNTKTELVEDFESILTWVDSIYSYAFLIAATLGACLVVVRFMYSQDKKKAVSYAVWWVVGFCMFSSLQSIVTGFKNGVVKKEGNG